MLNHLLHTIRSQFNQYIRSVLRTNVLPLGNPGLIFRENWVSQILLLFEKLAGFWKTNLFFGDSYRENLF